MKELGENTKKAPVPKMTSHAAPLVVALTADTNGYIHIDILFRRHADGAILESLSFFFQNSSSTSRARTHTGSAEK